MNIEIKTLKDLRDLIISASGGDPEAQQSLNAFLNFKNDIERSNFPMRSDLQLVAYAGYGKRTVCKSIKDNPFEKLEKVLTSAYMGYKSEKSKQFVEMMKQTPTLAELTTAQGDQPRSLKDKILGRKKEE